MEETNIPGSAFTDRQLKFSYWYVSNKLLLRKVLVFTLIVLNCLVWSYSIYGLIVWGLTREAITKQTLDLMLSPSPLLRQLEDDRPQQLTISGVSAFNGGDSYNFIAEAFNPNPQWIAEFEYAFVGEDRYSYYKSYALPGKNKFLLDSGRANSNATLEIRNIKWQKIENFAELQNIRERIDILEQEFIPAKDDTSPSILKFTVKNDSAFSYWETNLIAILYSGGLKSSINYITAYQLQAGESRTLEMNWPKALPKIDAVEIIPETNYLDPKNIILPTGNQ